MPWEWYSLFFQISFLAHLAKGNVSFGIRRPLTFHILIFYETETW